MNRPDLKLTLLIILVVFAGCQNGSKDTTTPPDAPAKSASSSSGFDPSMTDLNRVKPGTLAPDFELEDINGRKIRLSDYRNQKYVVLVFYRGYF
jgi:hypothetical protein